MTRTYVITGAASGIGATTAQTLREQGHTVIGVDLKDAEVTADALFQAMKVRGTRLWIAERNTSKMSADAWEAGDEVSVFEVTTDSWQATDAAGYIKAKIPMQAAAFELNGKVAA